MASKPLLVLVLLAICSGFIHAYPSESGDNKIVGGSPATQGQFPYQVNPNSPTIPKIDIEIYSDSLIRSRFKNILQMDQHIIAVRAL